MITDLKTFSDVYSKIIIPGVVLSPEEFEYYESNLSEELLIELLGRAIITRESESKILSIDRRYSGYMMNNIRLESSKDLYISLFTKCGLEYNSESDTISGYLPTSDTNFFTNYSGMTHIINLIPRGSIISLESDLAALILPLHRVSIRFSDIIGINFKVPKGYSFLGTIVVERVRIEFIGNIILESKNNLWRIG